MIKKIESHPEEWKGYAALFLAISLFSTIEVTVKMIGPAIPPLRLAAIRFLLAGALLWIPAFRTMRLWHTKLNLDDLKNLTILGLIGVTLALSLYHLALKHLQANVAAIIFSANPVFVSFFAPWLLGEKPTLRQRLATITGLLGIAILAFKNGPVGVHSSVGALYLLGSQIAFALYSVLSKKHMPRLGAKVITCFAGLLGGILILPLAWKFEGNPFVALSMSTWFKLLYLAGGATALAYIAFFWGITKTGAARGSTFFFLKPTLASLFAWLLLGEELTLRILFGALIILASLLLTVSPQKAEQGLTETKAPPELQP